MAEGRKGAFDLVYHSQPHYKPRQGGSIMLQLFGILGLLLASACKPQTAIEMMAENGSVVIQTGDARCWTERITLKSEKVEFEFRAEGNLIIAEVNGFQIQGATVRYNPTKGILLCKGDADNKARLSIKKKGEWHLDKEAKTISYFIGGAFGFED
jgi:hypothetical protein